jgi:NADP-dependent 3-hydroxy acid dehydrogenase YdfG
MERFTNDTVLITGGTGGIGLATARRFLDEGAHVVITGRDRDRLDAAVDRLGFPADRVLAVRADVTSRTDLDHLAHEIRTRRGGLDTVFANAGTGIFKPGTALTEDDIDHTIDVNFKGVLSTVRTTLPLLRDGGAIVVNASWTLHRGLATATVYAATKAAVLPGPPLRGQGPGSQAEAVREAGTASMRTSSTRAPPHSALRRRWPMNWNPDRL